MKIPRSTTCKVEGCDNPRHPLKRRSPHTMCHHHLLEYMRNYSDKYQKIKDDLNPFKDVRDGDDIIIDGVLYRKIKLFYFINMDGDVINLKSGLKKIKTQKTKLGYKIAMVDLKTYYIARLVYTTFKGKIGKNDCVVYKDNNKDNTNFENLEKVSKKNKHKYQIKTSEHRFPFYVIDIHDKTTVFYPSIYNYKKTNEKFVNVKQMINNNQLYLKRYRFVTVEDFNNSKKINFI